MAKLRHLVGGAMDKDKIFNEARNVIETYLVMKSLQRVSDTRSQSFRVSARIDVDARQEKLNMLLLEAAERGDKECAKKLLGEGADVNSCDQYGWTPLMAATFHCRSIMVEFLLSKGANTNARDNYYGRTALMDAVMATHESIEAREKVVELLLNNGADANIADNNGQTPLGFAEATKGLERIAELLRSRGAR